MVLVVVLVVVVEDEEQMKRKQKTHPPTPPRPPSTQMPRGLTFASDALLSKVTPSALRLYFQVTSRVPDNMYPAMRKFFTVVLG
ncbi:hypothetical protein O3P69_008376 [Scylla paramamosain]|uniref:Uncharacterized protein n=1 Tax=Scylla paramamosain TaxID=85552 RepID=A0AAW0SJZ1_SCYPA